MKKALITGGMGFIGSFIARQLIEEGTVDTVVLLDHFGRYISPLREEYYDYTKYRFTGIEGSIVLERGDTRNYSVAQQIVYRHDPEFIVHLAALPLAKLDNLTPEEACEGTVVSTSNLLHAVAWAREQGKQALRRFVYASSSMVYGDFKADVAEEDSHPTYPKEPYGTMKLAGENVTRGLTNFYGLEHAIVRPSAVYGPTDMNRRVSQIYVEKALRGEVLKVFGEDEKLDFTYVKDIANGFILAATHPGGANQTFNITTGKAQRLLDYVLELKNLFPDLRYEVVPRDAFRPKRGTLSIDKARRLMGYEPAYDLARGVAEYVDFVRRANPELARREA
ncbi:NAD-dependent epimerase/dehydratase family protein [Desulfocurvus sp.]|jgi:nucleoside-diphosphate-sugar epimerase|uniref:NAD-dependent epimerase/dehydratase family protein n=1 Tax=Desulfocurvus sp. TaxID=2871698 RepID=UPI0025C186ED|nr:NAD-dependent epimerase/dehydratase family protein [Desulfocurvus sp.]